MPQLWAEDLPAHRSLVLGRLLDAYGELVSEVGLDGVTLAGVAARADIARSAIYNYVPDRHGLVLAHAEREVANFVAGLTEAVEAHTSPVDQLAAYILHTLVHSIEGARDDLMPLLTDEEQGRVFAMLAPLRDVLEAIIRRGVDADEFAGDPRALVDLVWATLAGYRMPIARGHIKADEAVETATTVLLAGLRPPA